MDSQDMDMTEFFFLFFSVAIIDYYLFCEFCLP